MFNCTQLWLSPYILILQCALAWWTKPLWTERKTPLASLSRLPVKWQATWKCEGVFLKVFIENVSLTALKCNHESRKRFLVTKLENKDMHGNYHSGYKMIVYWLPCIIIFFAQVQKELRLLIHVTPCIYSATSTTFLPISCNSSDDSFGKVRSITYRGIIWTPFLKLIMAAPRVVCTDGYRHGQAPYPNTLPQSFALVSNSHVPYHTNP